MDFASLGGPIISAGASLIGAKMTSDSNAKAARLNAIAQAMADEKNREYNERLQKEFAQNSIRWKAEDARAAGIHPAFALGAPTTSFSTHVGSQISPFVGSSMGSALASAGQDIGRAVASTATGEQKLDAYTGSMQKLNLEKAGLENQLLKSQLVRLAQTSMPDFPSAGRERLIPGQGNTPNTGRYKLEPQKVTMTDKDNRVIEPKTISEVGFADTRNAPSRSVYPIPSEAVKERIEDNFWLETMHFFRNNLLPMVGANFNPPAELLKSLRAGQKVSFHPIYGYQAVRDGNKNLDGSPASRSLFRRSR